MFETFCLRLAAGLVFALLILPANVVSPRFFRIQLLIVLGLTVAAGVWAWGGKSDYFWLALGIGGAACLVGTWSWSLEGAPAGYLCIVVTLVALFGSLAALRLTGPGSAWSRTWLVVDDATAAALLGVATTAMLMGHWYLISPTMSLQPLLRLLAGLFITAGLRTVVAGIDLGLGVAAGFDRETWLWLPVRWGVGLIGVLALGWMAWRCAKIRSTQSATGILYVVVIFAFLGELTAQLLQSHWTRAGGGWS